MNKDNLNKILDSHKDWLAGGKGERANLGGANLIGANLSGANLSYANLSDANLTRANLSGASLIDANLIDASLIDANLIGANLGGASLGGASLIDANLSGANLSYANLSDANLTRANLSRANLIGANLSYCAGERSIIKSIFVSDIYPITYTNKVIQIGCESHCILEWWEFDDRRILEMDGKKALKFWREWKDTIKMIIEKSPAVES